MTSNYTAPVVSCAMCDTKLSWAELRFLWSDRDFLEHGDHYASVRYEDEPAYWRAMHVADRWES